MTDTKPAEVLLPTVGSHWLHRKSGGTYYVLAVGKIEADLTPVVVYQSTYDDKVWVRPLANFMDGRFEQTPDPRAAQPEVAPDDEALNVHRFSFDGRAIEVDGEYEFVKASEVRRRIAELQYAVAVWRGKAEMRGREGAEARAALAACRAATIEECAAIAAPYPQTGFPIMPAERLVNREREIITESIRALKTKEPTNG